MSVITRARIRAAATREERAAKHAFASSGFGMNGCRRVYHYHVRKTAGTALNHSFFTLSGGDPATLYRRLTSNPAEVAVAGDIVFVVWNKRLIERGCFHYGASHYAMHEVRVPAGTFTVTCVRDPVERVISFYRMFLDLAARDAADVPPWFARERTWLGGSFMDFLERVPPGVLQHQLYMFSRSLEVDEALTNLASCSHVIFTEEFERGLAQLGAKLGLRLPNVPGVRRSMAEFEPSPSDLTELKGRIEPERRLFDAAQARFLSP